MSTPSKKNVDIMLTEAKSAIESALPKVVNSDRFIRVALTEIRKSRALQECNPVSVCSAVMQAAQLGLEFGSALGQIYLVPYNQECNLMIGYRGYISLLQRSGAIKSMFAYVVYDGDEFSYELGLEPKLVHKPCGKQTDVKFVYAIAVLNDGQKQFEVMSKEAVEYIRDTFSRGKAGDTWKKSFGEMAKKTVIRRLIKLIPITPEVADALRIDEPETIDVVEKHDPQKYMQIQAAQANYVGNKEFELAESQLESLAKQCDDLGIDISDLSSDPTPQELIAIVEVLKKRILDAATSKNNR